MLGRVLAWSVGPLGALITVCFTNSGEAATPPAPAGGGGWGEGGAPTIAHKRPKGEGAPQGGAGRGRAAERGRAAHDSGPPERRKPDPQGRADTGHPEPNKTWFLLGSSGGCRRRTLAAERFAPNSRKKFRKTGEGVRQHGGVLRHPPMGDVRRETVSIFVLIFRYFD